MLQCNSMDKRRKPRSLEIKEKIRQKLLGRKHSLARVEANRKGHIGLKHSPETIEKMKGRIPPNKGKKASVETKEKQRQAKLRNPVRYWKGKKRLDISIRQKGNIPREAIEAAARVHRGKPLPIEVRNKISKAMGGKNHYNWKGGITSENQKIRRSLRYKEWRGSVFKRDNYTCVWGGKKHGSNLQADHIKSFALYPKLRFEIDNGRTLCIDCHKLTKSWSKR